MLDTLTESFCERCGTRYEFAAPEKLTPMRKTRGVITGLKNYIMSQDSLSDSLNDAMRSQAEVLASRQLDAFHESFSFCIDCRQYTCTNCWNDAAGRCQSCQPLSEPTATWIQPTPDGTLAATAWPVTDLTEPPANIRDAQPLPEPLLTVVEPVADPEPVAVEEEPAAVAPMPEPEPEPVAVEEEPEAVAPTPEPEPEAVEEEPAAVAPTTEAPPQPEPTPIRPLRPLRETFGHLPRTAPTPTPAPRDAVAAAADEETLAARKAQLDLLGIGDPGQGPVGPERRVLPYRSSGAASPIVALAGGAFWDASAREVSGATSQVGVRTCAECELSLSATARFCRRCGHPQAQSA
jgi:hypothetical protein